LLDGSATAWLNDVEVAARGTLDINATIDDFEGALSVMPLPWSSADAVVEGSEVASLAGLALPRDNQIRSAADESSLLAHFVARSTMQHSRGQGLWWAIGPDRQWIEWFVAPGWPSPQTFVKMIGGTPSSSAADRLSGDV
jgi:hypothetical protein